MAHVGRRWKRVLAVGCTHGNLAAPQAIKDVLEFNRRFQPHHRIHLGDGLDTTCFRRGARGSKDGTVRPHDDFAAFESFWDRFEPTVYTPGNHEWRLFKLSEDPDAIVSTLASQLWERIQSRVRKSRALTCPYSVRKGWVHLGGVAWGHGHSYAMNALRETAKANGMPTVMAHLHTPHQLPGRTVRDTPSFCVGALADEEQLAYGHERLASLEHAHGFVYGEMTDTEAHLWLVRAANGEKFHFPPGI